MLDRCGKFVLLEVPAVAIGKKSCYFKTVVGIVGFRLAVFEA